MRENNIQLAEPVNVIAISWTVLPTRFMLPSPLKIHDILELSHQPAPGASEDKGIRFEADPRRFVQKEPVTIDLCFLLIVQENRIETLLWKYRRLLTASACSGKPIGDELI
jgi:hypothetical protein